MSDSSNLSQPAESVKLDLRLTIVDAITLDLTMKKWLIDLSAAWKNPVYRPCMSRMATELLVLGAYQRVVEVTTVDLREQIKARLVSRAQLAERLNGVLQTFLDARALWDCIQDCLSMVHPRRHEWRR